MLEKATDAIKSSSEYTDIQIAEVTAKIVKSTNAVPVIYADPANLGFATNKTNITPVRQTIKSKIHVIQFGTESLFELAPNWKSFIPKEFEAEWDEIEHTLTLSIAQEKRVVMTSITLPVLFHAFKDRYWYGDESSNTRYVSTGYELVKKQPYNWNSMYGTYFVLGEDGETLIQNSSSEWKEDTYYELIINGNYGGFVVEDEYTERTVELAIFPVQGGRYLGSVGNVEGKTDIQDLEDKKAEWQSQSIGLLIGDYITWVGESGTSGPVEGGSFDRFKTYRYTGNFEDYEWSLDTDRSHVAECYNDIMKNAKNELEFAEANPDVYNYFKDLYASSIIARTLAVNDAFVENMFANKIIITEKVDEYGKISGGSISSSNFDGSDDNKSDFTRGFCLDHDGKLYAAEANIKGNITAKSLKIGENDTDVDSYIGNKVDSNIVNKNKGNWVANTDYKKGDNVYYINTGSTYACIKDCPKDLKKLLLILNIGFL